MTDADDRYLWDRTGPPDDDVVALERALAPLRGHAPEPVAAPARARPAWAWAPFAAAAAALVVALGAVASRGPAAAPAIVARDDAGRPLAAGAWVTAGDDAREVVLGAVGRVTVRPGARVQVRALGADLARLYLERGAIEASISAAARPRLFQVDTGAGRCVDLGCRYVLTALPDGDAHVRVTSGRVAFEAGDREVYVPAGAEVTARRDRGPGTPWFSTAGAALREALDAFDAARIGDPARLAAARRVADAARTEEDLLPPWHWLTDPDADVARIALDVLVARAGAPPGWTRPAGRPGAADREAFRALLDAAW